MPRRCLTCGRGLPSEIVREPTCTLRSVPSLRACAETIERPRFWYLRCGWRVHRDQTSPFHICQIAFEAVSPTPILCTSGQNRDRSIVSVQALRVRSRAPNGYSPAFFRRPPRLLTRSGRLGFGRQGGLPARRAVVDQPALIRRALRVQTIEASRNRPGLSPGHAYRVPCAAFRKASVLSAPHADDRAPVPYNRTAARTPERPGRRRP